MAKYGAVKAVSKTRKAEVPHRHVGAQGGGAFDYTDPVQQLLGTIGGMFFNEPTFYGENIPDARGLTEQAADLVACMEAVAQRNPEDLLVIANWARHELKLRATPQVALAVAAQHAKATPLPRIYACAIMERLDDMVSVLAAWKMLYGEQKTPNKSTPPPHNLLKAFRERLRKYSYYEMAKYQGGSTRPCVRDILLMVAHAGNRKPVLPLPKEEWEYWVNDKPPAPETKLGTWLESRSQVTMTADVTEVMAEDIKHGGMTWENMLSNFGNTKETWEKILDSGGPPYMALIRNLRNILAAGVSPEAINGICSRIQSGAVGSKLLPFRFYSAIREINPTNDLGLPSGPGTQTRAALFAAMESVARSMPKLPGNTLVCVDCSGSMGQRVSEKSTVSLFEAAAVLAALTSIASDTAGLVLFASKYAPVATLGRGIEPVLSDMLSVGGVGSATTAQFDIMRNLIDHKVWYDRIAWFSDFCMYQGDQWTSHRSLGIMVEEYRQKVNPNVVIYSCNFAGYGQTSVSTIDPKTVSLGGFSERLLDYFAEFEGRGTAVPDIKALYEKWRCS